MASSDSAFSGSIPAIYDHNLGPLLFEGYAADMARRAEALHPSTILETAAGTGIVTAVLAERLPDAQLTVTDLNPAMLEIAKTRVPEARATYLAVDATSLPFDDGAFDLIVTQFGIMFFPDRVAAYREALRVLKPEGTFLFNAWCPLADNPIPKVVHEAVAAQFPGDPPGFLARTPYGHGDHAEIERELGAAGFGTVAIERVELPSRSPSPAGPARGFVMGSPLRMEVEARAPDRLEAVADAATKAVADVFGNGPIAATMAALVVTARR